MPDKHTVELVIQIFFGSIAAAFLLLYSCFVLFGKIAVRSPLYRRIFCEGMGWHRASGLVGFDGCSATSQCITCDKRILQDSQGNWFAVGK